MSDLVAAIVLGMVEGITEFLPVSSTAHLRIAEALMGISLASGYWKTFSVVIQLGAVLAIPLQLRHRIAGLAATFPRGRRGDRGPLTHPLSLTLLAFLVTSVVALLMLRTIGRNLESLSVMGWSLVVGGVLMGVVDAVRGPATRGRRRPIASVEDTTPLQALWVGLCQSLAAIFPGASRSMTTIVAGELAGMSRPAALEFSFLLFVPTMLAATGFDLLRAVRGGPEGELDAAGGIEAGLDAHRWLVLGVGTAVSFAVAYLVVGWLLRWVQRRGFAPFAIWRLVVGAAVLLWLSGGPRTSSGYPHHLAGLGAGATGLLSQPTR